MTKKGGQTPEPLVGVVTKSVPDRELNPNFPDNRHSLYRTSFLDLLN
jgi:hypothetical protein